MIILHHRSRASTLWFGSNINRVASPKSCSTRILSTAHKIHSNAALAPNPASTEASEITASQWQAATHPPPTRAIMAQSPSASSSSKWVKRLPCFCSNNRTWEREVRGSRWCFWIRVGVVGAGPCLRRLWLRRRMVGDRPAIHRKARWLNTHLTIISYSIVSITAMRKMTWMTDLSWVMLSHRTIGLLDSSATRNDSNSRIYCRGSSFCPKWQPITPSSHSSSMTRVRISLLW